jgi:8-oxo-dGTP pyrophosphatase MutT (NUDIX family)
MKLREEIGHDLLLCPGVAVIAENSDQQILLQKRSDTGEWDVPGGEVEIGDTFAKSAVKELYLSLLNILKPV